MKRKAALQQSAEGTAPAVPAGEARPGAVTTQEPCNVAVIALHNRTKIGKAIVAAGPVDFPITMSDAKALKELGKVEIAGIFAASA